MILTYYIVQVPMKSIKKAMENRVSAEFWLKYRLLRHSERLFQLIYHCV